jgi:hypothetical protein
MKARLLKDIRDPTGETDEVIPAGTIVEVVELTVENNGNCFPLEAYDAEIILPTFDDLGFEVWGTGGGSAAYGLKLPDGRTILLTNVDGNWIPDEDNDEAVLVNPTERRIGVRPDVSIDFCRHPGDQERPRSRSQQSLRICRRVTRQAASPSSRKPPRGEGWAVRRNPGRRRSVTGRRQSTFLPPLPIRMTGTGELPVGNLPTFLPKHPAAKAPGFFINLFHFRLGGAGFRHHPFL